MILTATSSIPNLVAIGVALPYGVSRQLITGSGITPSKFIYFLCSVFLKNFENFSVF